MIVCKRAFAFSIPLFCVALAAPAKAGTALYDASFSIHAFGNDYFGYFASLPIGAAAIGSGAISVTATGSEPAPVALPQSAFGVTTGAYWPIFLPSTFYWTYATFANEAGGFFAGGGPAAGKGTISHEDNGNRAGSWFIHEGENAFGGTLGLLGKQGAFAQFQIKTSGPSAPLPGIFTGSSSWNMIRALGRSQMDPLNPYSNTGVFLKTSSESDPYSNLVTTYVKFGSGTPWTTGTVTVIATEGSYATSLRRSGYDTTTPGGARNIQLVTPALTHWARGQERPFNHTGHIAMLKIQLVPEPSGLAMFAAGLCVLLVTRRAFHGSPSRRDFAA